MPTAQTPQQHENEARQIAAVNGLLVTMRGGKFVLYRKTGHGLIWLGRRSTSKGLRTFVTRCVSTQ